MKLDLNVKNCFPWAPSKDHVYTYINLQLVPMYSDQTTTSGTDNVLHSLSAWPAQAGVEPAARRGLALGLGLRPPATELRQAKCLLLEVRFQSTGRVIC